MKEQLTIKDLAPYLLYDLVVELLDFPLGKHYRKLELDCGHDFHYYLQNNKVRPILRPLSDLTKKHKDYIWFEIISTDNDMYDKEEIYELLDLNMFEHLPIMVYDYFFKNHFDVFNLIPKGLAIDVNQLDNVEL